MNTSENSRSFRSTRYFYVSLVILLTLLAAPLHVLAPTRHMMMSLLCGPSAIGKDKKNVAEP